jgi:rod shape-determining protein MreC
VDVHIENQALKQEVDTLRMELSEMSEYAASVRRLERLLDFPAPPEWSRSGARVIAHDFGPLNAVNSLMIDRGELQKISPNLPVVTPAGVVGRTFRTGFNFSSILLLSDPNSRIPVISSETRVRGILSGRGYKKSLSLEYVHLNSPLEQGELLVTSGLAGIYPRGLPVARVQEIFRSDISLFLVVEATPLVESGIIEEVLVLQKREEMNSQTGPGVAEN